MNYGEKYVKEYNKSLKEIVSNAIKIFQNNYNTNKSFKKVEKIIQEPIVEEMKTLYNQVDRNGDLFQKSHNWFKTFKENYTFDKSISVINDEIKTIIFDKTEDKGEIKNYLHFVNLLQRRQAMRYYFDFISKNEKNLTIAFNSKKIKDSFTFIEEKRELNTLKELNIKKDIVKSKISEITELSDNEKLILLNILMSYYKKLGNNENKIPDTELFRLLILCSGVLKEDDFFNINSNNTNYKYFQKGIYESDKNFIKKREDLQIIIQKLEKIETLKNITIIVKLYRTRMKNHLL